MNDETASRSHRVRQHVLTATRPIGSMEDVTGELEGLHEQVAKVRAALAGHRRIYQYATHFPWFFPVDERRSWLQRLADKQLASVEDRLSQDALAVLHRASSIVQQLRARAAGGDASALLCTDLAEALVLQAVMQRERNGGPKTMSQVEPEMVFDLVVTALEEVKVPRMDHAMDGLIERARDLADVAAAIYADIAKVKQERNQ